MKVRCPHCFQKYSLTESQFGQEQPCGSCGQMMIFSKEDVIASEEGVVSSREKKGNVQLVTATAQRSLPPSRSLNQKASKTPAIAASLVFFILLLAMGLFLVSQSSEQSSGKEESEVVVSEGRAQVLSDSPVEEVAGKSGLPTSVEKAPLSAKVQARRARKAKQKENQAKLSASLVQYEKTVVPLLERVCTDCHDSLSEEGDLNLEYYLKRDIAEQHPKLWEKIAKMVIIGQMPPSDRKKQLTPEEQSQLLSWIGNLSSRWEAGEMGRDPGRTTIHRLNKYEYNYTVRDLFGLRIWLVDDFPEDGSGESGFSNNADSLFLPTLLAENYFEAAEKIVAAVYSNPQARSRFLISKPKRQEDPTQAAHQVLRHWAGLIYRRPASDRELEKLLATFRTEYEKSNNYDQAMKMPLFALLISPNFLYRSSVAATKKGVYPLSDFELASKLSYFLWSSMPDRELFELAQRGELSQEKVLVAQVKRMLADERAESLGRHLGGQWFGWEDLRAAVNPDEKRFPEFDTSLRIALYQESATYFNHLVKTEGSLYDLLDSDYTFLNDRLARFYELPPVSGGHLRLVKLTDRNRGGVLGMGSVLTATSLALRSSPSIRGSYVLQEILGVALPEPPMNVEPLPADDRDLGELSLRQSMEEHRTNPDCRSCHREIDPIGFGLEAFDAIGRYRTHQNGVELDTSGTLPDGTTFDSPAELKQALLNNKSLFIKNTTAKILTYALGRELTPYDRPVIKEISDKISSQNGSIQTAFIEVAKSYPFRNQRGENFTPSKPSVTRK